MRADPFEAAPLRGLDPHSRQRVEAAGQHRALRSGQTLFSLGESADDLFVVLRGRVRVEREGASLRVVEPGQTVGEEALLDLPRRGRAVAAEDTELFAVSAGLLHRAWTRSGGQSTAAAERRRLERAVIADALRSVLPTLEGWTLEVLLDASALRTVDADGFLARAGDPARAAALLLDGVVHLRPAGSRDVLQVAMPPDALAVVEACGGGAWTTDAVAAGPCRVVWVQAGAMRSVLGPAGADLLGPRHEGRAAVLDQLQAGPSPHAVDVHRLERARSLLIIDQDTCVRCGACTRACADSHADGLPRMAREGPRLRARMDAPSAPVAPWLLARACQHCSSPACLPACPTAAIRREGSAVSIDAAACTGCAACAKACPWDAIEMAPRPEGAPSPPEGPFASVAVKCDLCPSRSGPACAHVCPTQALHRVDPGERLVEARALLGRPKGAAGRRPRFPWPMTTAALIGCALIAGLWTRGQGWSAGYGPGLWLGWMAAAALLGSVAYAGLRRLQGPWGRGAPALAVHAVLGAVTLATAWGHGGARWDGAPGALAMTVLAACTLGLVGWLSYQVVPHRLSRLEAEAPSAAGNTPPSDTLLRAVGGRSDMLKQIAARVLLPYAHRRGGGLVLLASGRSLAEEIAVVRGRLEAQLGAARLDREEGLDSLVAAVVSLRARRVRWLLRGALRVWLAPHIVLAVAGVGLLAVHVWRGGG